MQEKQTAIADIMICQPAQMLLAVAVLRFYKLRSADVQYMVKYNNKEISKDEAENRLKEKYGPAADLTY